MFTASAAPHTTTTTIKSPFHSCPPWSLTWKEKGKLIPATYPSITQISPASCCCWSSPALLFLSDTAPLADSVARHPVQSAPLVTLPSARPSSPSIQPVHTPSRKPRHLPHFSSQQQQKNTFTSPVFFVAKLLFFPLSRNNSPLQLQKLSPPNPRLPEKNPQKWPAKEPARRPATPSRACSPSSTPPPSASRAPPPPPPLPTSPRRAPARPAPPRSPSASPRRRPPPPRRSPPSPRRQSPSPSRCLPRSAEPPRPARRRPSPRPPRQRPTPSSPSPPRCLSRQSHSTAYIPRDVSFSTET